MRAMLLAAGLGTRLRPLTDLLPKPAVPLLGRPLAHYALDRLLAAGVTELAANAHHLPDHVARVVRERVADALISVEPELLGTGGGIRRALTSLADRSARPIDPSEPLLISNADVLFAPDLTAALAAHRASGAFATMILRRDPRAEKLGPIEVDAEGRVRRILRAPEHAGPLQTLMFTGLSILSGAAVLQLPEKGCLVRQGYRLWLDRGENVHGVVESASFRDLGSPGEYLGAHLDLLSGAARWDGITPASTFVDPSADVAGARLDRVVVGPRSRVEAGVSLERVVVWPDTVVRESDRGVILFPSGRLVGT
jgi:mannose-1-phosphate guanylyltransferase